MMDAHLLNVAGYRVISEQGGSIACIAREDESHIIRKGSVVFEEVERLCGLLSNVSYMAEAIDFADDASEEIEKSGIKGKMQFEHLLSRGHLVPTGLLYFALRRFERRGDFMKARAVLQMLAAGDGNDVDHSNAAMLALNIDSFEVSALHEMARELLQKLNSPLV